MRLRLSLRDRVLGGLRWTLGLAGAVVVLWLGSAFLATAPAAAAVAMPVVAVQQGLVKTGGIRPAGGGDGDSDSGSDSGGSDSSDGDSDSSGDDGGEKSESDSEGEDDSDSDEKKSDEKDSDEKKSDEKKSDEKDSEQKDSEESDQKKSDESDRSREDESGDDDRGTDAQEERRDEDAQSGGQERADEGDHKDNGSDESAEDVSAGPAAATDDDDAQDAPSDGDRPDAAEDDGAGSEDAPGTEASAEDGEDEGAGDDRTAEPETSDDAADAESAVEDAAAEISDRQDGDDSDQEDRRRPETGDEKDESQGAPVDASDELVGDESGDGNELPTSADDDADETRAEADETRADPTAEQLRSEIDESVRDDDGSERREDEDGTAESDLVRLVTDAAGQASIDDSTDDSEDRDGADLRDAVDAVRSAAAGDDVSDDDVDRMADTALAGSDRDGTDEDGQAQLLADSAVPAEDYEERCGDGADCASSESEMQQASLLSERGPPSERSARESDDDDDDRDEDEDRDDSAERTEQVLEDRIEVDKSKDELEQEKQKLASGSTTQADYDKKAAEHADLEKRAAENREEASDDEVELVDDVVDGHRELSKREKELAAEEAQVGSGSVDRDTHEENVADYEERRDDVYEATEELMEATGREVRTVSEDDLDGEGSAAGCGSDGAFTGCGSVSESADGERDSERRLCLSGVSSGCGASSESGGSKAEASCDDAGCGSSASSRGADGEVTSASARCDGDGCRQSSKATRDGASAECESGGGSCRGESRGPSRDDGAPPAAPERKTASSASCSGDCDLSTRADRDRAEASCGTAGGSCESRGSGSAAGESEVWKAGTVEDSGRVEGDGAARCEGSGGCRTSSAVQLGEDGESVVADADVDCAAACEGRGTAITSGSAGAERESNGAASCVARGGACDATSETRFEGSASAKTASSTATASVDCGDATACSGEAGAKTDGKVTGTPSVAGGPAPVRETSAASTCAATDGGCATDSASHVSDAAASSPEVQQWQAAPGRTLSSAGRELTAGSEAGSRVRCAMATCTGRGWSTTSGAATGDVVGVRSSTGGSSCTAHGAGGGCSTATDTTVADRSPDATVSALDAPAVSGPASVTQASASVECGGVGACGGTAASSTSARDTGVSPHARGTSATAECSVSGGRCSGGTSSVASSAPDFVVTDPATGLPVAGQPTAGPSSTSSSSAGLVCAPGTTCSGSVRTSTTAWDGAVANGAPRTSEGSASCTGATGGCEVRSASNASSGPGAALALSVPGADGQAQPVNAARLPAGPSAASAAGATMTCAGEIACTGKVTSAATTTDPSVSPDSRGSHSEGSCEGVSGGVCQAVTNSGASSGPDANVIAPLVAERSTANATVTSGTTGEQAPADQPEDGQQPATLPAPTAPGSSANSGAPTVPGSSSWTMASASLDCASGVACTGTARSSAAGSDGPTAVSGANGARGPPEGVSTTSATCTSSQSGCQAQTSSTAASGQVVADVVAEQNIATAEQLAVLAAQAEKDAAEAARAAAQPGATPEQKKTASDAAAAARQANHAAAQAADLASKPVTDAPATTAESSATAQCAGPGCTASTTGATSGVPGTSTTTATCTAAASGCLAASNASTSTSRDTGDGGQESAPAAKISGSGRAGSSITCPEAGCTGAVTGSASAKADAAGQHSASAASGDTRCDGTTACQGRISVATTASSSANGAATNAMIAVSCADGSAGGCATRASSSTTVIGGAQARATGTATCAAAGGCTVATGGSAGTDLAEATASCDGTGCRTHTAGEARAASPGGHTAALARSDCTAGANGQCAGSSRVAVSANYALASASCTATEGSSCSHSWSATASTSASHPSGSWARASARYAGSGGIGSGGGWVFAQVDVGDTYAMASVSCSDEARCTKSYAAHVEFDISWTQQRTYEQDGGIWNARRFGDCKGSSGSGCGLFRNGNNVQCTGDCSNFRQTMSKPAFTMLAPAGWRTEATAYPIAALDSATKAKAEQTGRDLRAYDRTKIRDVPDNQIIKAYKHTKNAEKRMEKDADQIAATAHQQAVEEGASPAQANRAAQNYRASYFDAVAGTAVDPYGNVPDIIARAQTGAMGELNAAVGHKLRFDALQAAGDAAARAFNAKYTAVQSEDRDARTVMSTAAAADASMQAALDLAAEAAALGRDFAARHGATASQADKSGQVFQSDYIDVVNASPQRGKLQMLADQNLSSIGQVAEEVWQGAGVELNRPDVPDNHLPGILNHEAAEAEANVAAAVERAGELAYQDAVLSGMSVGNAEKARDAAMADYQGRLGAEIVGIGVTNFGKALAPSYVMDRAGGTGVIDPEVAEVLADPALADGLNSSDEIDDVQAAYDAAVAATKRPADALADLAPYIPYDPIARNGDRQAALLSDPRVVEALAPGGDIDDARHVLDVREGYLAFAHSQQNRVQRQIGDFNSFVGDYEEKLAEADKRGGLSPDEALLLKIQYKQIVGEEARLNSEVSKSQAEVYAKTGALIPVDIAIAEASGNTEAANNLRAASANLDKIQAIGAALPRGASAEELNRATGLVLDLRSMAAGSYANVRDSSLTTRLAGGMRLPSSGAPDARLAATAASELPTFAGRISDNSKNRVRQIFEAQNPDDRARLAAHYTPGELARLYTDDMEGVVGIYYPASPNETAEQKAKRYDDFLALVENGQVEDFNRITMYLSARDKAILEDAKPSVGERYYLSVGEKVSGLFDATATGMEATLGITTKDSVMGNAIRDVGTIIGYAPVGAIRTGEWAVQSAQYYVGVQRATFDPTGPHFDAATAARIAPRPGDTWDKSFTRKDPLLGNMFVTPTANMVRRWAPAMLKGDTSKLVNGDPETGLMGYRDHPILTFMEDITPFSLIGGVASLGLRIPAMVASSGARAAARAATVAEAGALQALKLAKSGVKSARIGGKVVELDSKFFAWENYRIQNLRDAAKVRTGRALELGKYSDLAAFPNEPVGTLLDLLPNGGPGRLIREALNIPGRRDLVLERQIHDAVSALQIGPEYLPNINDCVQWCVRAADDHLRQVGRPIAMPPRPGEFSPDVEGADGLEALEKRYGVTAQETSADRFQQDAAHRAGSGFYLVWSHRGDGSRDHMFVAVTEAGQVRYYDKYGELAPDSSEVKNIMGVLPIDGEYADGFGTGHWPVVGDRFGGRGDDPSSGPLHRERPLTLVPHLDAETARSTRVPSESERVYVRDGLLYRADTGRPLEEPPPDIGYWAYVLDEHGNFYVIDPKVGHRGVLGDKGRVAAAGMLGIVPGAPGTVAHLNTHSGGFPNGSVRQLQRLVEEQGLDLSRVTKWLEDRLHRTEFPNSIRRPAPEWTRRASPPAAVEAPVGGCFDAMCAYGSLDPSAVDLNALPRTLTDPTVARDAVQGVFRARFEPTSHQQLLWRFATAPDGAEFVVWIWSGSGSTSHMVYGRKSAGRMEFYDQRGRLSEEEAGAELVNARLVLRRETAWNRRDVDVSGVKPVGAVGETPNWSNGQRIDPLADPPSGQRAADHPTEPAESDTGSGILHQAPSDQQQAGARLDHPSDRNGRSPPSGAALPEVSAGDEPSGGVLTDTLARQLYESRLQALDGAQLRAVYERARREPGSLHPDPAVEARALARAAFDKFGIELYRSQEQAAAVMAQGSVAGLPPAGGKTYAIIAAQLEIVLRQARESGGGPIAGVDVWTPIQDLATRDGETAARIWQLLGEEVFVNHELLTPAQKQAGSKAIVRYHWYVTFGHDRLAQLWPMAGREFIVDEFDWIAVRNSDKPLVITEPVPGPLPFEGDLRWAHGLAPELGVDTGHGESHVEVTRSGARPTEAGLKFIRERPNGVDLTQPENAGRLAALEAVLTARYVLHEGDADSYVVDRQRGTIQPLDSSDTKQHGAQFDPLLDNALRLKHGLPLGENRRVVAETTPHEILSEARTVSGATGTPDPVETKRLYPEVESVDIGPENPSRLVRLTPVSEGTSDEARGRAVSDVATASRRGRPTLVNVESINAAEDFAAELRALGLPVQVLHARTADEVAVEIIANSGRLVGGYGMNTVVSPRGGRGTHYPVGGDADRIAQHEIERRGLDPASEQAHEVREDAKRFVTRDRKEINSRGGFYQARLGLRAHPNDDVQEEHRIARNGDNGETRTYVSDEDRRLQVGPLVFAARDRRHDLRSGGEAFPIEVHRAAQELEMRRGQAAARGADRLGRGARRDGETWQTAPTTDSTGVVDTQAEYAERYDLAALAAARLGHDIPWLGDAENAQLKRDVAAFHVEHAPTSVDHYYAAARVRQLIPRRELVPALPVARDALRASLAQAARTFDQAGELANRMSMNPAELAATLAVAARMLERGEDGDVPEGSGDPYPAADQVEELRLAALDEAGLGMLLAYANGRTLDDIAAAWSIDRAEAAIILDDVVDHLAEGPGRRVVGEHEARQTVRQDVGSTTKNTWEQVRDRLREIDRGLHPAERETLWHLDGSIEELLGQLSDQWGRNQLDAVYQRLVAAGITSIAQLDTAHTTKLRAAGLTNNQIQTLRGALPPDAGGQETRGAPRDVERRVVLAAQPRWGDRELADALALSAGLPEPSPDAAVTAELLDGLREANGLTGLTVFTADLDLAGISDADVGMIAAFAGLGPVRFPPTSRDAGTAALLMLDARIHAGRGDLITTAPDQPRSEPSRRGGSSYAAGGGGSGSASGGSASAADGAGRPSTPGDESGATQFVQFRPSNDRYDAQQRGPPRWAWPASEAADLLPIGTWAGVRPSAPIELGEQAHGHAAAFGGTTEAASAAFLELLPDLYEHAFFQEVRLPGARGPPVVLIDNDLAWSVLTRQTMDLPGRLIGFGWWHSRYAPNGKIVMFGDRAMIHLLGEVAAAQEARIAAVRVGTPEAMGLLLEGGMLKWTLRADGTLWISRPFGALPGGQLVEITHAVIGGGDDALAAGEIFLLSGRLDGAAINAESGHYHSGNDAEDNIRARAVGRAAFARFGIQVRFDFVSRRDDVKPGGAPLVMAPVGIGLGSEGVPAWLETVTQFAAIGVVAAAAVLAVVKIVRVVRARGPPSGRGRSALATENTAEPRAPGVESPDTAVSSTAVSSSSWRGRLFTVAGLSAAMLGLPGAVGGGPVARADPTTETVVSTAGHWWDAVGEWVVANPVAVGAAAALAVVSGVAALVLGVWPTLFRHVRHVAERAALAPDAAKAGHRDKAAAATRAALEAALDEVGDGGSGGFVTRWLRRTAAGRGIVARVVRAKHVLRLDRPITSTGALPLRPVGTETAVAVAVASGGLLGAAGALVLTGIGTVAAIVSGVATSTGLSLALRLLRWIRQARAPTAAATPVGTGVHIRIGPVVAGLVLAGALGAGLVRFGADVLNAILETDTAATWRRVAATFLISSVLTYHSVLRKQSYEFLEKGIPHRVRGNAFWSAAWTALFSVGVALALPTLLGASPHWLVLLALGVPTALVASLVVRKSVGRDRLYGAAVGAVYGALIYLAGHVVAVTEPARSVGEYLGELLIVMGVAAPGGLIAATVESTIGKRQIAKIKKLWRTDIPVLARVARLARLLVDFQRIKRHNTHAEMLKLDGVVGIGLAYLIVRPSTVLWLTGPIAATLLVAFLKGRDKLAARHDMIAETGGRVQRRPVRYETGPRGWLPHLRAAAEDLAASYSNLAVILTTGQRRPDLDRAAAEAATLLVGETWERLRSPRPVPTASPLDHRQRLMEDARAVNHVLFVLAGLQLGELRWNPRIANLLVPMGRGDLAQHLGNVSRYVDALRVKLGQAADELIAALESPDAEEIHGVSLAQLREGLSAELRPALDMPRRSPEGAGTQLLRYAQLRNHLRVAMFEARRDAAYDRKRRWIGYGANKAAIEHVDIELLRARTDLEVERQRAVDPDPLNEITRGFGDRAASVRRRYGTSADARLAGADVFDVLRGYGIAVTEARRSPADRRNRWRRGMAAVPLGMGTAVPGGSVLAVLLVLAAEPRPVRITDLHNRFGRPVIDLLSAVELVVLDEETGMARANEDLRRLWRYAPPVLRAVLRRAPGLVPDLLGTGTDGRHLRVLLAGPGGLPGDAVRRGGDALLDILRGGAFVFRRDIDGVIDDAGIVLRTVPRMLEQTGDVDGRIRGSKGIYAPLEIGAPTLRKDFGAARESLEQAIERALRARLLRLRTLRVDARVARHRAASGLLHGPPVHGRPVAVAAEAEVMAFTELAKARTAYELAARRAGVPPHRYLTLLRRADVVLQHRPGIDPPSGAPREQLLAIRAEIRQARTDLAEGRSGAVHVARLALIRHLIAEAAAWEAQFDRTLGGWHLLRKLEDDAREFADAIRAVPPWAGAHVALAPAHPYVVPQTAQDGADQLGRGGPVTAAVRTENGGDPVNHDAGSIGLTGGGSWFAVVADGVASGSGSRARELVAAARRALVTNGAASPQELVEAALDAVAGRAAGLGEEFDLGTPVRINPPGASLTVVVVSPDRREIAYGGLGDVRVYWADAGWPTVRLTEDDRAEGALTRWFAADRAMDVVVRQLPVGARGTVLLLSDGAWTGLVDGFDRIDLPGGAATGVVEVLFDSLHRTQLPGLRDDATIAAIVIDSATPAAPSADAAATAPLPVSGMLPDAEATRPLPGAEVLTPSPGPDAARPLAPRSVTTPPMTELQTTPLRKRWARGEGRLSWAAPPSLAGLGVSGVPSWLEAVAQFGLGVLVAAAVVWGIRVMARGWTAHGPPGSSASTTAWPGPDASPAEVARWWAQLDRDARERAASDDPAQLGRMDGVPLARRVAERLLRAGLVALGRLTLGVLNVTETGKRLRETARDQGHFTGRFTRSDDEAHERARTRIVAHLRNAPSTTEATSGAAGQIRDGGPGPAMTAPDRDQPPPPAVNRVEESGTDPSIARHIDPRSRSPPAHRGPATCGSCASDASDRAASASRDIRLRDSTKGRRGTVPPALRGTSSTATGPQEGTNG